MPKHGEEKEKRETIYVRVPVALGTRLRMLVVEKRSTIQAEVIAALEEYLPPPPRRSRKPPRK